MGARPPDLPRWWTSLPRTDTGLRSSLAINEISYTFASWAVRDCPGHWVLNEGPGTGRLRWIEGQMAPEDALFDDFAAKLPFRGA